MTQVKLKKLLHQPELAALLGEMTQGQAWGVTDASGNLLAGTLTGGTAAKIHNEGEILGWVYGSQATFLARWLQYVVNQEQAKRTLAQETLDRYREVNLLYDLAEKMHATLDLQALADLVIGETQALLGGTQGCLMLYNPHTQVLEVVSSYGPPVEQTYFPPGMGIAGHVFQTGRAEIVNDVSQDARFVPGLIPIHALMCAPLTTKAGVLGVINVTSETPVEYTASHLKRLMALAAQAALAISNARAHADKLQEERLRVNLDRYLGGRYRILRTLGTGGFGHTYLAEDLQRPGTPACVVKQLQPARDNPTRMDVARRLFRAEAETLEVLGKHDQIPALLAYFEQDEDFYLVQEYIDGQLLSEELAQTAPCHPQRVIQLIQEILNILAFVHHHQVIHRDLKPDNIIRRRRDRKLVLIDFGSVKQCRGANQKQETIAVGTRGYAPSEQYAGRPRFSSDIYAVGIIAIQALTGLPPSQWQAQDGTGQLRWRDHRPDVPADLAQVLDKMVCEQTWERYAKTSDVLKALEQVSIPDTPDTEILTPMPPDPEPSLLAQSSRWLVETARRLIQG
ncbi:protein kinase [Synechococcus sp. C9]|uniref:protein kinase domain-containing protein n=1 Tax=Synechococcus sp. C9 TaxID=102119 RepID=UPI001FF181C5|nr:protein kinase [Synechococcus sp. C9]